MMTCSKRVKRIHLLIICRGLPRKQAEHYSSFLGGYIFTSRSNISEACDLESVLEEYLLKRRLNISIFSSLDSLLGENFLIIRLTISVFSCVENSSSSVIKHRPLQYAQLSTKNVLQSMPNQYHRYEIRRQIQATHRRLKRRR